MPPAARAATLTLGMAVNTRLAALALLALPLVGCVADPGFVCAGDTQCGEGRCETSGRCSFADESCDSGRRYGEASGSESGLCVSAVIRDAAADAQEADAALPPGDGGQAAFAPSNLPAEVLTAGSAPLQFLAGDGAVLINTDSLTIVRADNGASLLPPGIDSRVVAQGGGAPELAVFSAASLFIDSGVLVEVHGDRGLALAVGGGAEIGGILDMLAGNGRIDRPAPGGFPGGSGAAGCAGQGPGGAPTASSASDVGGGGGGHVQPGAAGGDYQATAGGGGGAVYGAASLVPLVGGSGGACGGGGDQAAGGGGGGGLQISAGGAIKVTGALIAAGNGGQGGVADSGGGGGGAGGAILLEAPVIEVSGRVTANGGGGGAGADKESAGADGQSGRSSDVAATGGAAAGDGAAGGDGGAGVLEPRAGGAAAGGTGNAGGGGGAGGRIRLRADDLSRPGTLSPTGGVSEAPL